MSKLTRKPVASSMSLIDLLVLMGEGNIGAMFVLKELYVEKGEDCLDIVLRLNDMNIRGGQIWVGYKDHCKQDLEAFVVAVYLCDEDMIKTVNRECGYAGHLAVASEDKEKDK